VKLAKRPETSLNAFGPFDLLEKVGRGGSATVYKARRRSTGAIVAVKIGTRQLALNATNFERFRREFTEICHLRHPYLVSALEFGEEQQVPYLVLEFVDGQNLQQRLQETGPLPWREAVAIILHVAGGLRILHRNRIVHRDIKPGNVLISRQGVAKLADFGLLKSLSSEERITGSRQAMGTIEFGAPEQFEDAMHADFRCDIYSLAATLYAAVTGLFPFGSGSLRRILQRKLRNKFVPLSRANPMIPAELDELISQSLQADRERRPAKIDEFMATLKKTVKERPRDVIPYEAPVLPKGASADRRRAARASVRVPAAFVPFHQNKRHSFQATILDVGAGGICLQTTAPVDLDMLLEVTAAAKGELYLVQVRWSRAAADGSSILGCSFVCRPDSQEIDAISR
jgi:serine/threonine protein kinase